MLSKIGMAGISIVALTGCSQLSLETKQVTVAGKVCTYVSAHGNLYGPGVRRLDLYGCEPVSTAYGVGPDAGVALGTAGIQGGTMAGGLVGAAAVFSPPASRTNVSNSSSGSGGASSSGALSQAASAAASSSSTNTYYKPTE